MRSRQLLQRTATQQNIFVPNRPKSNVERLQFIEIKRKHLFKLRQLIHVGKMLFKQSVNLRTGKVINSELHGFNVLAELL